MGCFFFLPKVSHLSNGYIPSNVRVQTPDLPNGTLRPCSPLAGSAADCKLVLGEAGPSAPPPFLCLLPPPVWSTVSDPSRVQVAEGGGVTRGQKVLLVKSCLELAAISQGCMERISF